MGKPEWWTFDSGPLANSRYRKTYIPLMVEEAFLGWLRAAIGSHQLTTKRGTEHEALRLVRNFVQSGGLEKSTIYGWHLTPDSDGHLKLATHSVPPEDEPRRWMTSSDITQA